MTKFKQILILLSLSQTFAAFGFTHVKCTTDSLHAAQAQLELNLEEVIHPNILLTVGEEKYSYKTNILQYVETQPTRLAGATWVKSNLGEGNYISIVGYHGKLSGTAQLPFKTVTLFLSCTAY